MHKLRKQKAESRKQKTEFRIQKKEYIFFCSLSSVIRLLSSVFCHPFFVLCLLSSVFSPLSSVSAQEKIVAIINTEIITQKDLDEFLNFIRVQLSREYKGAELENKIQSMKADLLDKLIEDKIILQEAKKNNIKIDDIRVKAKIDEIKKRYPSDSEFRRALKEQGLVEADLELKTKEQLLMYSIIDTKIRRKIIVSPSEVTEFYQKSIKEFKSDKLWEFDIIEAGDETKASEIAQDLIRGEKFDILADKYSLSINKMNVTPGQLRKEVEDSVLKLKPHEISPPIKIEDKYYFFRLNRIIPEKQKSLSDVQDDIYKFLYNKKMQEELAKWLEGLKKQAYIKIIQN